MNATGLAPASSDEHVLERRSVGARRRSIPAASGSRSGGPEQAVPRRARARPCQLLDRARRDRCAARPERRRQVDADPDLRRRARRRQLFRRRSASPASPIAPMDVADAEAVGVALVPQEVNIVPDLTVAENITLNDEPTRWGLLDIGERQRRAKAALAGFALDFDPDLPMSSLDLASQQLVVIARALAKKARLLILDEPTAALTESESLQLFERMRALKSARRRDHLRVASPGRGFCHFRPHRRHARRPHPRAPSRPATSRAARSSPRWSARRPAPRERAPARARWARRCWRSRGLGVFEPDGKMRVAGLDLAVRKGEVVGLFGLLGAGCIEAALAIYGAYPGRREGHDPGRRRRSDDRQPRPGRCAGLRADGAGPPRLPDRRPIGGRQYRHRQPRQGAAQRRRRSGRLAAAGARRGRPPAASRRRRSTPRCRRCRAATSRRCRSARWLAADTRILHHDRPDAWRRCRRPPRDQGDLVRAGGQGAGDPACLDRCRGTRGCLRPGHRHEPRPPCRRTQRAAISPKGI